MHIKNFKKLPPYTPGVFGPNGLIEEGEGDLPVWSNAAPPPNIGETVNIRVNGIGKARVDGYYTQGGYLGLLVTVEAWPPRLAAQNGSDRSCHVFGAEIS